MESEGGPLILYLVTEDWYFCSHRLPMARAARDAGFRIAVATRVAAHGAQIRAEGFGLHPLAWRRRAVSPLAALADMAAIRSLCRRLRPDLIHNVALKPVLLGAPAAWAAGVPAIVNALTGLGFVFTGTSARARLLRGPVAALLARVLRLGRSHLVLQNGDDAALLARLGVAPPGRTALIRGSGIDTGRFVPMPDPPGSVRIGYVGRMLHDKGVPTLVAAVRRLRDEGLPVGLVLAGTPDPENPASLTSAELAAWDGEGWIERRGHVADIRTVWADCAVAALPSRREGLPLALMEAAACGRPLVASDVPGCRDLVRPCVNGALAPPDDPIAWAEALRPFVTDAALRARAGQASRALVESDLSAAAIGAAIVALYRDLLAEAGR